MCCACRSPWPSTTRPSARRWSNSAASPSMVESAKARSRVGVLAAPRAADEARGLAVLARPPRALGLGAGERRVVLHDGGALVEDDQPPHDAVERVLGQRRRPRGWCARVRVVGQAPHLHGPLDDLALGRRRLDGVRAVRATHDRHCAEVHAARQPAVEPHLGLDEPLPHLGRDLVDEAEVHRLLRLVDDVARHEDVGDVRLPQLDGLGRLRVRRGLQQPAHVLGQRVVIGGGFGGGHSPMVARGRGPVKRTSPRSRVERTVASAPPTCDIVAT